MEYQPAHAIEILSQTPATVSALLLSLSEPWTQSSPDAEAWNPYDVIGHLIHGEETDWIPRAEIILHEGPSRAFEPFNRFAQFEQSRRQSLASLLERFAQLRHQNLATLKQMNITSEQWELRGLHPELGSVTLGQLIAAWAVHDLDHIGQIVTAMAKQYTEAVGPWRAYLAILNQ
jgi:DinB family protein